MKSPKVIEIPIISTATNLVGIIKELRGNNHYPEVRIMSNNRLYQIYEDSDPQLLLNFKGKASNLVTYGKERLDNSCEFIHIGNEIPIGWIHIPVFHTTDNLIGSINSIIDYLAKNPLYDYAYLRHEDELTRVHRLSPKIASFANIEKYFRIRKIENSVFWYMF